MNKFTRAIVTIWYFVVLVMGSRSGLTVFEEILLFGVFSILVQGAFRD